MRSFRAVVIGSSAGGLKALESIFSMLSKDFPIPLLIAQHLTADSEGMLANILAGKTSLTVREASDKETLQPGTAYLAPANYHLLVEDQDLISLSVDSKENYSRPSIDVLFESAADVYGPDLIGVILTGASADGALGLQKIQKRGGLTIVQDPRTAESKLMPESALKRFRPDHVLPLQEIGNFLGSACTRGNS